MSVPETYTTAPSWQFFSLNPRARAKCHKWSDKDLEDRVASDPRIQPQKRLLTPFLLDKRVPPIPEDDDERQEFPFRHTNFFSEMFFDWVGPIMAVGYRRTLEPEDLYKISPGTTFDVQVRSDSFVRAFYTRKLDTETKYLKAHGIDDTLENRRKLFYDSDFKYPKHLLLMSLVDVFKYDYGFAICVKTIGDLAAGLNALLVRRLISYIAAKAVGEHVGNEGYGYAVGIACIVFLFGICGARYFNDAQFCGGEIKGVLNKALLDKSFRIDREGRIQYPPSKITSYLGNDLSKIDLAASFFAFVTNLPIGLGLTIILLAINLGGAVLSGVAYFIIVTLCVTVVTRKLMQLRGGANTATDARIKYVKEVLSSIKIIKYYAWEVPYAKMLSGLRKTEMGRILEIQFIRNCLTGVSVTLPNVSAMIGFLAMFGDNHGHLKSTANMFSSLTLFNILTGHVAMFPTALTTAGDALVAFSRIQDYLVYPDELPDPNYKEVPEESTDQAIVIKDGCFDWNQFNEEESIVSTRNSFSKENDKTDEKQHLADDSETAGDDSVFQGLKDVNLNIHHGEFIVVTGSIGSGKSSLLSAIKGAMPRSAGEVTVGGNVTLCATPWIQNATVKENIYFGNAHDHYKYAKVVHACALQSDFDILPAGDETEIGERGVNLSGGQKARINLARAVFNVYEEDDKNIILFDDVLSAVDAKVGKHIMNECILGLLDGKTRVLATHQLALIGAASRIVFMNGDGSMDIGTREELMERNRSFAELMTFQMEKAVDKDEEHAGNDDDDDDDEAIDLKIIRRQTTRKEYAARQRGKLIHEETRGVNAVSFKVILNYISEGCGKIGLKFMFPNLIASMACTTFCMLFQNVWLSFWTTHKFGVRNSGFYIGLYVMFTLMFVVTATWQFCTIVYICNNSATNLNIKAMNRIMHAPMAYFDTTPMGRILNRFTKDTDTLDNEIAEQARLFCFGLSNMLGILIMCCIFLPWFLIVVPFIFAWAVVCFSYYQASSCEVKRIEGVERSVVYSNFDEVLQGLETIKFYDAVKRFIDKNTSLINEMNEAYLLANSMQRWLAVRLHLCSALINLIISCLCASRVFPISASNSGLLVSYLVSFSMQLISTSRSMGQLEQYMSSVERVNEYAFDLPQEAAYYKDEKKPAASWPENGEIVFKDLYMRYRPELPYVLTDFTLHVNKREKIGICGRTGAGKSTIMTALYRLSEPEEGSVQIDNVDTLSLGLYDLRSNLTIIPQDPVLFRGTIRQNLDPFGTLSDEVLYSALVRAGCIQSDELEKVMQEDVKREQVHKFHLDSFVEDNGANFSLGQRQVLALCRALVKDTSILILDEATSSVDYETDARIQQTIASEFADCTILCIAHRLKTICNYDRILVMDKGRATEFDTPWNLYNMEDSIFRSMCDKSGIGADDFDKK